MEEGSKVVVEFLCCLAMERERERGGMSMMYFFWIFFSLFRDWGKIGVGAAR